MKILYTYIQILSNEITFCVNITEIQVRYQILLALWVSYDTLYDTDTNSANQLSAHGILCIDFLINLINCVSIFFFRTLKTLYLYIDICVNWCHQHHWIITIIIIIIIILFDVGVNIYKKCCQTSLDAAGIRVLPLNFRISSHFSITRTNYSSAKFVSATNLVCKNVDVFRKRITF
jgi:hypothetical protein